MAALAVNTRRPERCSDNVRRERDTTTSYLVRVRVSPRRSTQPTTWAALHGTATFPYLPFAVTSMTQARRGLVIQRELAGNTPTTRPWPGADLIVRAEVTFTMR
jgi:hypothetical protein